MKEKKKTQIQIFIYISLFTNFLFHFMHRYLRKNLFAMNINFFNKIKFYSILILREHLLYKLTVAATVISSTIDANP